MKKLARGVLLATLSVAALGALALLAFCIAPQALRSVLMRIGGPAQEVAHLIPPPLPELGPYAEIKWIDQGWTEEQRDWFHKTTQGTATFPVPYDWFMALERPELSLLSEPALLADTNYLTRFGFVPTRFLGPGEGKEPLPIGFAILPAGTDPVTGQPMPRQLGLTCAACHTGAVTVGKTLVGIDGGAAMVDLDKLEQAVGLAVLYANHVPGRATRFANRLLDASKQPEGEDRELLKAAIIENLGKLSADLRYRIKAEKSVLDHRGKAHSIEGAGRLDALNRIGNQVFFENLLRPDEWKGFDATRDPRARNFEARTAPVSFPHVWNTPWFLWAQYDASIFNESIRNVGEALGVRALVNLVNASAGYFRSTVKVDTVDAFEGLLSAKETHPGFTPDRGAFPGLQSPRWSEARQFLPPGQPEAARNDALVTHGRQLYVKHCFECHRGPVNDPVFEKEFGDRSIWKRDKKVDGDAHEDWIAVGGRHYLNVVQKPVAMMGTDPEQSRVLSSRDVYLPPELALKPVGSLAQACREKVRRIHVGDSELKLSESLASCDIRLPDGPGSAPFSLALMAVVARTVDAWYAENLRGPNAQERLDRMEGPRPNMPNPRANRLVEIRNTGEFQLVAEPHYRARPLNGVWATAPFLHNGSVPTLFDLLLPQGQRAKQFCVGSRGYNPEFVGLSGVTPGQPSARCPGGEEILDVRKPGNSNLGHSFEAPPGSDRRSWPNGVIGPRLTPGEREALLAYVSTL